MFIQEGRTTQEEKYYNLLESSVTEAGFSIYDVEYLSGSSTLRLYIYDKETKTADLQNCMAVDKAVTEVIEATDWIPESFVLEVSSPGLYRKIRRVDQLNEATGEYIEFVLLCKPEVKLSELPKKLRLKKVRGFLKSCTNDSMSVDFEGTEIEFKYDEIKKIKLSPEIDF